MVQKSGLYDPVQLDTYVVLLLFTCLLTIKKRLTMAGHKRAFNDDMNMVIVISRLLIQVSYSASEAGEQRPRNRISLYDA